VSEIMRLYGKHCRQLGPREMTALVAMDIHPDALGWGNGQFAVMASNVFWQGEFWFDFAPNGEGARAAIIVCLGADGQAQDLAAWAPSEGRLALRWGHVAMIGEEQLTIPRLEGDRLWVHPSPAEWLAHRRAGVVIVNYDAARSRLPSPIAVKTRQHKAELEERWRMPRIQVFDVGIAEAIAS
jgi:hypothetical protein